MIVDDTALLISGAHVVDGSGAPAYPADVIVAGGVIAAVLPMGVASAARPVDGRGKILCPGFIDSHSHDDAFVLEPSVPHPKLAQGVTTVVTGNCGLSLAPLVTDTPPAPLDVLGTRQFRFASFHDYLRAVDDVRPAVNVVPLVGHNTLRVRHMADWRRAATPDEQRRMRSAVCEALDDGAFGLSTGVYYPPSRAATTEELLEVCLPVGERQGIVAMHLRDEGDRIDEALREALRIGAETGARLVLSHHKVVGHRNFGRTLETLRRVEQAALTQEVCFDCYPYEASSTMLSPDKAATVGKVLISWSGPRPECAGRSLQSLADEWQVSLQEAAHRLMPGGAIYFGMSSEDVDRVVAHPLGMIGSDGLPHDLRPHPRLWGSFPRVLSRYVREKRLLRIEQAVHKMTGLPAQRFGLADRGLIAAGYAADLVLFDPDAIQDNASYDDPKAAPTGIEAVWVNGRLSYQDGRSWDVHAGRRLMPAKGS
jgi:N-acyl-D-amino-acid deacylase